MDLIIGAGITGLAYAAFTKNDYLIIEKNAQIGGYCKTISQDGFIWDYSGHFFHFQNEKIKEFVMRHMDQDSVLSVEKRTQIRFKNCMIDYPFQKNIHQLDKRNFINCLYDLFVNEYKDYSSFKSMLYAKFGKSIAEIFLIPYNEKLYACDLDSLDENAMGRFFPYANKEDVIANFKLKLHSNDTYNASFLYPKLGAIEYIKSVYSILEPSKISVNEQLISIDAKEKIATTTRRKIKYDNLISTMPLPQLLSIVGFDFDKTLYSSNKVLVFNLGFDKKGVERVNNWIYYPEKQYIFYRIGFYDNIFKSDRLSVYVEIGFKENEVIDENLCLQRVLSDMKKAKIITDHKLISQNTIIMD
ncbi:MAG: NAD(P)-binding protein, partial [Muribaculaceae bacterium]